MSLIDKNLQNSHLSTCPKIAIIGGINIPSASGLAYRTSPPELWKQLSSKYNVTFLSLQLEKRFWGEDSYRKLYLKISPRLLLLIILLLRGKFHLFIVGMFSIETIITFILSRLLRKPLILIDEHWYWQRTLPMRFLWPVARHIACVANALVVSGARSKKFWETASIPAEKIRIVYFDVNMLKVEGRHIKLARQIRESFGQRKIVLYFGRLVKRKGVDILIRAFARYLKDSKDAVLLVAGEGPEKDNLQKLCRELGVDDKVCFVGFVDETDKPAYFLASDIFVYPSITLGMPEIWGIAVSEAMSVGKPVIVTTALGCATDLVRHGVNGYVVPEKDEVALYKAIKLILIDKGLRVAMGRASEGIIRNFSSAHSFKQFNDVVKAIVATYAKQVA